MSIALAYLGVPLRLSAQDSARTDSVGVKPGAVVRVSGRYLPLDPEPATVVEQRVDTLVLRARDGSLAFVPLDRVTKLEVSRGLRSRGSEVSRGARTGALVVGVPSAVFTLAALRYDHQHRRDPCDYICFPTSPFVFLGGAVLTGVATLAGAAVGAIVPRHERWTHVPTPPVRVGIVPTPGGSAAVALGFRF